MNSRVAQSASPSSLLGADALVQALADEGLRVCFANPGTSEMRLLAALGSEARIRTILGLFEGVCTGAADGYARMQGKAAATLLHLGPGLANGLANLHNAKRAGSAVVNLVGDHSTTHVANDPPLSSDIAALAASVSSWVQTCSLSDDLRSIAHKAMANTRTGQNRISTVIVPDDCSWSLAMDGERIQPVESERTPDAPVDTAAKLLRTKTKCALLLGGDALSEAGLTAAARIRRSSGARLLAQGFPARLRRGRGIPQVERLAYFPDHVRAQLAEVDAIVLVGASPPVAFFAYPGKPLRLADDIGQLELVQPGASSLSALAQLADALDTPGADYEVTPDQPRALSSDALTYETIGALIAANLPEDSIVSDEAITASLPIYSRTAHAPPHDWLTLCGGAIGQGLPVAVGAAVACPDRTVIALVGDGSAMYTPQALWTAARESLRVVTVIVANQQYRILRREADAAGISFNDTVRASTSLGDPFIDWRAIAQGMGVESGRATNAEEFSRFLRRGFASSGPFLIEATV